jgi:hypothetical protein
MAIEELDCAEAAEDAEMVDIETDLGLELGSDCEEEYEDSDVDGF